MTIPLTERLRHWYEKCEVHFAVARPGGALDIGLASRARFLSDRELGLEVPRLAWLRLRSYLEANPWVALHPGELGAVKAPYQLKGVYTRALEEGERDTVFPGAGDAVGVVIGLRELYITKPGPEAGLRVDHWTQEDLTRFEGELGWLREENW
ncbi:MAG: hypothetical protein HPY69_14835 [Armatimonadetes bacterium]|nr:hypothetical protein [Armatimonadota bacterium]